MRYCNKNNNNNDNNHNNDNNNNNNNNRNIITTWVNASEPFAKLKVGFRNGYCGRSNDFNNNYN